MVMDSAAFSIEALQSFTFIQFLFRNDNIDSTNAYQEFQMTGGRLTGSGWVARTEPGLVATYYFHLTSWSVYDEIVFDTTRVLAAGFTFVDPSNTEYVPFWAGPYVVHDTARPAESNLLLSEDTLYYAATQGLENPPSQQFSVSSDNLPLSFTLLEDASWILKTPAAATTPADITVSVTTAGLTAGPYFDSIAVQAAQASNSPQYLYVSLDLAPPPPAIGVNPTSFTFNALAGGANPADQVLNISNLGGTDLDWSVSNTQAWLNLDPLTGTNAGQVTLSVDITGLTYGTYNDVITVSDPEATNSPVEVPVQLVVASDLPLIQVDPQVIYLPVDANWDNVFTREFEVLNGGGGSLAFTASPALSGVISDVNPTSGTAPATIEVEFTFVQWAHAYEIDTVWITSPDALNSPYPVIFHQRVVPFPAQIDFSTDTVEFTVYECSQGYGNDLPEAQVTVLNSGGDNPMFVEYTYESDLFEVLSPLSGVEEAPVAMTLKALETDLPVGVYNDSVRVTARWAENKPQWLFVKYIKTAGVEPPEIVTVPTALAMPWQEDSGPKVFDGFQIWNVYGGCMDWEIQESLNWFSAVNTTGTVPGPSPLLVDPPGYTLGSYPGSFSVLADGAVNSPYSVNATLQVWKFHGDWNWNGIISIQDIAMAIDYLFIDGSPPQPAMEVGDCNCNDEISVGDISAMIEYLFITLEPLCGNPY
jgi:hypothetical protein